MHYPYNVADCPISSIYYHNGHTTKHAVTNYKYMLLRFKVDQAECFRRGIDAPRSIVTVPVNPADLTQADRDLIADRLDGIDVCRLGLSDSSGTPWKMQTDDGEPDHVVASAPTFDGLMEALRKDEVDFASARLACGASPSS
jgi:hypothetical protein